MQIELEFPGGAAVNAKLRGHVVKTDQTVRGGGQDSAPAPFDLFLASIATCAGFYALRFCQSRSLETTGLGLTLTTVREPESHALQRIELELDLPGGFPSKYERAIVRAIDQCAVKRALVEPPDFAIQIAAAI